MTTLAAPIKSGPDPTPQAIQAAQTEAYNPPPTIDPAMPPEIAAALQAIGPFDPSLEGEKYQKQKDNWRLYMDLLELDLTKLQKMVDRHGLASDGGESDEKFNLRKKMAAVFNFVPTVINLIGLYLFSQTPAIDVKKDPDLEAFIANCDGDGRSLTQFIRETALPMGLVMGHVDVLVQNPFITQDVATQQQAQEVGMLPRSFCVTPLQRINWSSQVNASYNWLCIQDPGNESDDPLRRNVQTPIAYITISAATPRIAAPDRPRGIWIRSWRPWQNAGSGSPPAPIPPQPINAKAINQFFHSAGWTPTARASVATLYYKRSNDPETRHQGISKVATIAILTRKIIQVLSWTDEDVLANLALYCIPTPGGKIPRETNADGSTNPNGSDIISSLDAFTAVYFNMEAKNPPFVLQGHVDHIRVKLEIVKAYVEEILRLAHLIGASGETEKVTSGIQGTVMRSELFQELKDTANNLDVFVLDMLALAKSWATDEDWTRERLVKEIGPTVSFFKGPFLIDYVADVLRDATAVMEACRTVSPEIVKSAFKKIAQAYLSADDPALPIALKQIDDNLDAALVDPKLLETLSIAAATAAEHQTGTTTIREIDTEGDTGENAAQPEPTGAATADANAANPNAPAATAANPPAKK